MNIDVDVSDLLKKAKDNLEAAESLFKTGFYDFSASRIYYAMFYMTEAVLLTKNLSFSKHTAVIAVFGKEFIKTGVFPKILHRYLADAFDLRQLGDYGSSGSISKDKAQELIEHGRGFMGCRDKCIISSW
jgi:uncharacterized protein (UPF0332 family)